MTPASEERREVAERLRDAAHTNASFDMAMAIAILGVMGDVQEPIASVVADPIDPTCKVSYVETYCDEPGQLEGWEFHMTCGHSLQRPYNEPPAYCTECGARAVDE